MNVDEKTIDEEFQPSTVTTDKTDIDPEVSLKTEGETRTPRLRYVPNRHDRRRAAAEARKEAKRKGKK